MRFKLCMLSFLWRASVAVGDQWADFNLDPASEEWIREMLLNKTAGAQNEFPILIYIVHDGKRMLMPGSKGALGAAQTFYFMFPNVFLIMYPGVQSDRTVVAMAPTPGGLVTLAKIALRDIPALKTLAGDIVAFGKLPAKFK